MIEAPRASSGFEGGVDVRQHPLPLSVFQREYLLARRPVVIRTGGLEAIDWRTGRWDSGYLIDNEMVSAGR